MCEDVLHMRTGSIEAGKAIVMTRVKVSHARHTFKKKRLEPKNAILEVRHTQEKSERKVLFQNWILQYKHIQRKMKFSQLGLILTMLIWFKIHVSCKF